ncbi:MULTISPECIES: acyltransferase [Asticcacaulis]|uniref:acyltransferase family protein n=1 Tax=Asticcacaulis TaxID=76890 RepID=UPI001AEA6986|nr:MULTISPECIES: acyltransferase [Asticcacaulis]MBP2160919.1 peptidoglycan/LPS O-acetylase OafA/YrhL [Asticcacaulis solisilvae]MDR6801877.1 peptidoglycan/LPS O-acetylase OafA/YrhL [Asticcacaulis sp. BE141]
MSADASAPAAFRSEIKSLTGLRGIAALYVVLFHANGLARFPEAVRPFFSHGYMAVDLFFILSGFVMAMIYGHMFRNGFELKTFQKFLLLRLARIYPLYLLVTAITAVAITTVLSHTYRFDDNVLRALPFNLTMTHVWGLAYAIVPPSWSISTEWAAYLLFPAGVWLALSTPRRYAFLGVAAAFAVLVWIAFGPYWLTHSHRAIGKLDVVHSYAPGTTLRCLASFYIGLVAFRFKHLIPARAAGIMVVLALFLLALKQTDLWLIGVFTVLIMALSHDQGRVARALGTPVLHWLGVVSFALYLVHDLIQKVIFKSFPVWGVGAGIPKMAWVAISVVVSLGIAALAHYYFEKPSRVWARDLIKAFDSRKPVFRPAFTRVTGYLRSVAARPLPPAE